MSDELAKLRAALADSQSALNQERSARKAAEESTAATFAQMQGAVAELEQFAYITSHDLQAPLRNITGFSQLLVKRLGTNLTADAKDYLGYIQSSVRQMQTLIDDLLTFSRVGRTPAPAAVSASLDTTLSRSMAQLAAKVEATGAMIEFAEMPVVEGDHKMLAQLFMNLLDNAIKFQAPGNRPLVKVSAQAQDDFWLIKVSDNGIGIAAEHLESIFDVFRRLHTQEEFEGTGIGLAICRKVAGHHGATIWAESEGPAKGSSFTLKLPRASSIPAAV